MKPFKRILTLLVLIPAFVGAGNICFAKMAQAQTTSCHSTQEAGDCCAPSHQEKNSSAAKCCADPATSAKQAYLSASQEISEVPSLDAADAKTPVRPARFAGPYTDTNLSSLFLVQAFGTSFSCHAPPVFRPVI